MVFVPRISFKTGINPSMLSQFPTNGQYTGTQKLMLTRTRIFGDKISGNYGSGMKPWRKPRGGRFEHVKIDSAQLHNVKRYFPWLSDPQMDKIYRILKQRKEQHRLKKEAKKEAKKKK